MLSFVILKDFKQRSYFQLTLRKLQLDVIVAKLDVHYC